MQNPLYISKIKLRNGQGDHVLVVSALEFSTFKKYTYVNFFFSCNIYIFLAIIINISIIVIIIIYSLNLFIQACNYCFYMLMSWFLLVHTCLTYDAMYVLSNYK